MTWLLVGPLLIPFATAVTCLLAWRAPAFQRGCALAGSAGLLAGTGALLADVHAHGVRAVHVGGWPARVAIPLVADQFSAIMLATTGLLALVIVAYSRASVDPGRLAGGYHPFLQLLLMGVCGVFLTGDLFNLFVWFEVTLVSSFVLLALGGERAQLRGAITYVALNLLGSLLLLSGVGVVYALAGTLNLGELAGALRLAPPALVTATSMLFLVALGIKSAVFPFFFWLPASYPAPPVPVSALFAGLMTKVGVYALIRLFTLVFVPVAGQADRLILVIAGLTMVTGVLGAVVQLEMRRLLSFHVVSQIGYLLMGLGLGTPLALLGAVFFMVHIILTKTALFLVGGIVHALRGTHELNRLGDLAGGHPGIAALFLLPALSLAGVPPFSGFFAKLALVQAGLVAEAYLIVAVAVVVSLLTLYSMIKIWTLAFWGDSPDHPGAEGAAGSWRIVPTAALAGLVLALGFAAQPLAALAGDAANALLDPDAYIQAVAGRGP